MTRAELRDEQARVQRLLKEQPDEFHPDPRVAAAFADLKANTSTQNWLVTQLDRIQGRLDTEETSMDLVHKGETERLLEIAKEERKHLEEVADRWRPSKD